MLSFIIKIYIKLVSNYCLIDIMPKT
jgi:hypothetical protein